MLALAIISTVILSIFILFIIGAMVGDEEIIGFIFITLLGFLIIVIWILYVN